VLLNIFIFCQNEGGQMKKKTIRVSEETHRQLKMLAAKKGTTIEKFVGEITENIKKQGVKE
jgi:predicted DNA-binding protein